jgi:hypothetical protein
MYSSSLLEQMMIGGLMSGSLGALDTHIPEAVSTYVLFLTAGADDDRRLDEWFIGCFRYPYS